MEDVRRGLGVQPLPPGASAGAGTTVGVLARHHGFFSPNLCRVVHGIEEDGTVRRRGFAYGTLAERARTANLIPKPGAWDLLLDSAPD